MAEPHNGEEINGGPKDEVLRRLGRNLLLFQEVEHLLKWLASKVHISGFAHELSAVAEKTRREVAKDTLGGTLRRATDARGFSERDREAIETAVAEGGGMHFEMSTTFTGLDGEPDAGWQARLESLVESRNNLVHHFLEQFDLKTPRGCHEAIRHLDQEHVDHAPVVEELQRRCECLARTAGLLAGALNQDDIRAEILHGPVRLRLDALLGRVARERAREDGWTYLNLAGQELTTHAPDLLKSLKKGFGHAGLKEAVAAMEGFEVREESTDAGARILYRPRA